MPLLNLPFTPILLLLLLPLSLPLLLLSNLLLTYLLDPHHLRHHPPIHPLAPLTNLAYIHHLLRLPPSLPRTFALHRAHAAHPILRLGPNSLSFRSPDSIRDIYGHSSPCTKADMYETARGGGHANILSATDRGVHAVKRKRLAAAFAARNLEGWEGKVRDKCERLVRELDARCGSSSGGKAGIAGWEAVEEREAGGWVDFRLWFNLFTVEAIADIALSERLGVIEAGDDVVEVQDEKGVTREVKFIDAVHGIGRAIAPIVWSKDAFGTLKWLSKWFEGPRRQWTNLANFGDIVQHLVRKRLHRYEAGKDCGDFVKCLLEDKEGQPLNLSVGEIAAEVSVFLDAGSDTTAIALTHVLYLLVKNPEKLARLRESLRACGQLDIPWYDAVKHNAYLRACLDESLRLLPPVAAGLQRKTPPGGSSVDGKWIAGNTLVSTSPYVAHRNPDVFPDPEAFLPERWLEADAKEMQRYFIAFSAGARGCIGRNLTYLEQTVLLATLVRRYDFALPDPDWEMRWEEKFNFWPQSLPVRLYRRSVDM
ncbi:MAG: hypothetical protein Q9165_002181 [Trypethelium subeluteriae]